jgi:hypothetical protein
MVDQPDGRGQRDPDVIRLSHQYAACPTCQLILPLYADRDGAPGDHLGAADREVVPPVQVARCGLCKRPLHTATPWPLDLKLRCPDCGALIRAPTQAAVLACPGCDSYFANPSNSPEVRQRVQMILAEQARIAQLVNDLDRRLEQVLAEAERQRAALSPPLLELCGHQPAGPGGWPGVCLLPAGHPGPHGLPAWPPLPRRRERIRVPEEWIDQTRPLPLVFAEAFTMAVQGLDSPRERLVATLRYGLDDAPGRTFQQIGQALGRSPARARQLLWNAWSSIALAPLGPDPTWSPQRRACGVAVHLATDVLGDPTGPQAPARVRAFVDRALPHVRPRVSAQLLIELADLVELEVDLRAWGRDQALCRAVAAVSAT